MQIVADENIPLLDEFFADLGTITRLNGRTITAADVQQADILLVRSVTKVNPALLQGSKVKFVGTCTIGTDHIDLEYLQQQHIAFASAPGCNAHAVADYVQSSLLTLLENREQSLAGLTAAVVGVGNVGSRVRQRLESLGLTVLGVDPFKDEAQVGKLVPLAEALPQADIICVHTPLTTSGSHPTQHLIGAPELQQMKPDACLLNAGRGPVVDNAALLSHVQQHKNFVAILDVWESEPEPDLALLERCLIATPHIAGYSLDGKMRGTEMVYQALCQFLNRPVSKSLAELAPEPAVLALELSAAMPSQQQLSTQVRAVYDVRNDDGRMRYAMRNSSNLAKTFDYLRKNYPLRRDIPLQNILLN